MAWTNITTRATSDTIPAADVNDMMEDIRLLGGNGTSQPSTDIETLDSDMTAVEGDIAGLQSALATSNLYRNSLVGNVVWKDADEIIIKPRMFNGQNIVGAFLNDGTFLTSSTAITVKLDTPGNSGHILDGITAKLANSWYILWAYEDGGGSLAFGLTTMAATTFSTNNPTDSLTLNTVNGQNIGYLYSEDADLLVWNASTKFETWRYNTTGGHTPTGACSVVSRTATVLTLDGNLGVANFSANDYVIQLNNFKPLAVDDGLIVDAIGARGYLDTGIRIRTDAGPNIIQFSIQSGNFIWGNGTGAADYTGVDGIESWVLTNAYLIYRSSHTPVDKVMIATYFPTANGGNIYTKSYWETYGFAPVTNGNAGGIVVTCPLYTITHGLCGAFGDIANNEIQNRGYIL